MTTTTGAGLVPATPESLSGSRAPAWWGMVALLTTEGTLFLLLIFSYFYLRWESPRWPPDGIPLPDFKYIIPATVLLLGSSIPMIWAERGIKRGNQGALRIGAAAAWLMAACFMALELYEWTHLTFGPKTDAYGSLYFTITGFHLAHLSVALTLSVYLQLRAWLGHFDARRHLAVENISLYWHFVDAVWILVFSTVYISPFIK